MDISVTVCNVDKVLGVATTPYVIERGGERVALDLCAVHAAPIEELVQYDVGTPPEAVSEAPAPRPPIKAAAPKPTPQPGRRARRTGVVTLDEIEQQKRS